MAGSESSVTLLVAAVSLLTDNPAAMQKLVQEIRSSFKNEDEITLTSVNRLNYLTACLNETMRCFPGVPPALPRVVPRGGAVITGHAVPENVSYLGHYVLLMNTDRFRRLSMWLHGPQTTLNDILQSHSNFTLSAS
jgi:cytochrome P450